MRTLTILWMNLVISVGGTTIFKDCLNVNTVSMRIATPTATLD